MSPMSLKDLKGSPMRAPPGMFDYGLLLRKIHINSILCEQIGSTATMRQPQAKVCESYGTFEMYQ